MNMGHNTHQSVEKIKIVGLKYPAYCGELVERVGKFGRFLSCNNYPRCKLTPVKSNKSC